MRKKSTETIVSQSIALIKHEGCTWEEAATACGYSVSWLQKKCKEHYKRPENYEELKRIARENKKRKEKELHQFLDSMQQPVNSSDETPKKKPVKILVETGYVMKNGIEGLLKEEKAICIPAFCVKELERQQRESANAEEFIKYYREENSSIIPLNVPDEVVFYDPNDTMINTRRLRGITAAACDLYANTDEGVMIKVYTNSIRLKKFLEMQRMEDRVEIFVA